MRFRSVRAASFAWLATFVVATLASPGFAQDQGQSLDTETIRIVTTSGRYEIEAEIADEPEERQIGLMHRTEMAADHGMLFVFDSTRPVTMWMKNTPMSLDMLFIRPDGTIARVAPRTTPFSLETIPSGEPVSHVLELRAGVARMLGIRPGDRVVHGSFTQ